MNTITVTKEKFTISTDKSKLDIKAIHDFLSKKSYWCKDIPMKTVEESINNSLNFGLFCDDKQIGFARVITDYATIAYLGDVYVLEEYRGRGLSKWLMEIIMTHPDLQGLRRWILLTADAHELYKKYGWTAIKNPEKWMEKHDPNAYNKTIN